MSVKEENRKVQPGIGVKLLLSPLSPPCLLQLGPCPRASRLWRWLWWQCRASDPDHLGRDTGAAPLLARPGLLPPEVESAEGAPNLPFGEAPRVHTHTAEDVLERERGWEVVTPGSALGCRQPSQFGSNRFGCQEAPPQPRGKGLLRNSEFLSLRKRSKNLPQTWVQT